MESEKSTIQPEMSEEEYKMEALKRAARERKEIVNKYIKGIDSEGEEDHWEDSAFVLYKITDRYGFLHEKPLPEQRSLLEDRRKQTEIKREFKWLKMLQKWKQFSTSEKLRKRIYKGIPLKLRGDAWRLMLNVTELQAKEPDMYQNMKERSLEHSPDIKQIDMDVNRTYRNHIMFRKRYCIKQQQLFYVLAAYSMYNTEVGYCQGMSQIAALLLMYMSEEEAFWALHSLLYGKKHRMHGFFIPGFPKLIRFQDHHDKILKKFVPRLKKHLDKNEIFASLYTMKWFFQCFLDRSPFPLTLRLWDIYVYEGERVLVAMSYTTLKMHKTNIKKMEMDGIINFLQERLALDFGTDDDLVVDQLKANMNELRKSKMDLPPSPSPDEDAKLEFGTLVKPSFAQETGLRISSAAKNNSTQDSRKRTLKHSVHRSNENESNGDIRAIRTKVSTKPKSPKSRTNAGAETQKAEEKLHRKSSSHKRHSGREMERNDEDTRLSGKRKSSGSIREKQKKENRKSREYKEESSRPEQTDGLPQVSTRSSNRDSRRSKASPKKRHSASKKFTDDYNKQTQPDHHIPNTAQEQSPDSANHAGGKVEFVWKKPKSSVTSTTNSNGITQHNSSPTKRSHYNKNSKPATNHQHELEQHIPVKESVISESTNNQQLSMSNGETDHDHDVLAPLVTVTTPKDRSVQVENRPYSVYDNILAASSEPETHKLNSSSLANSTAIDASYNMIMEESLENLRELAASLPVSPDSPYRDCTSSTSSGRHHAKPINSFEILDDDVIDESGLSSLDEVALSLSKSVRQLEQKQKQTDSSRSSAFRKAVEGAGIMQLPKRPSSTALNAALSSGNATSKPPQFPQHHSTKTSSANIVTSSEPPTSPDIWVTNPLLFPQPGPDRPSSRPSSSWYESTLDGPDAVALKLEDFESQPIDVNMSLANRNTNNNSRTAYHALASGSQNNLHRDKPSSEDLPHQVLERRKTSSKHYKRHETYISENSKSQEKNRTRKNKDVRNTSSSISSDLVSSIDHRFTGDGLWESRVVDPSSDRLHPSQLREMEELRLSDPLYSRNPNSRTASSSEKRLQIRPHAPSVVPPSYPATSHYPHSNYHVIPSNSTWSPTRRKDSSTVAVQTETPHLVGDSTLV